MENGCRLAWLIDPENEEVIIYRPEKEPNKIIGFDHVLSGELVLPDFELRLELLRDII